MKKVIEEKIVQETKKTSHRVPVLVGIVILTVAIVIGVSIFFCVPRISLKGDKEVVVNLHDEYHDAGVKATYWCQNVNDDVKMIGNVDTDTPGEYKIEYQIKEGYFSSSVERTIFVKDVTGPEITLTGGKEVYLCKGSKFIELGYKAVDEVDGDVSDSVEITTNDDLVMYKAVDKSGNETVETRQLFYQDKEAPVLKLKGSQNYSITIGSQYKDPGVEVTDNCDKNLSSNVTITGSVNTQKLGTYSIKYEVSDMAGNKATAIRNVRVIEKAKGGVIYLTFDDGPNQGTTNVILDVLKQEGVKATFFVTNRGPDSLIKREYDEGHTVALHTATHNYKTVYSSVDAYFADLDKVHDRVQRITGTDARIIRFPGGSSNTISRNYSKGIMTTLTKEVVNRGYYYYDWNVDSNDAGGAASANAVYQNVIKGLSHKRANVVLMHDIKSYTRDAIKNIIHYGKENGYTFEAITNKTPMVTHRVNN